MIEPYSTFLLVSVFAVLLALSGWRVAFLFVLFVGLLQDLLRKAAADQPVVFVMLCVVVVSIALIGAMLKYGILSLKPMAGTDKRSRLVLALLVAWVLLKGMHALFTFGSPLVAAIGVLSYLLPIPALWLAYVYLRDEKDLRRFLKAYVVVGGLAATSVVLDSWEVGGWYMEAVGGELLVFDRVAGIVKTHGGFWRTSEIAAWHAGTTGCFAMMLFVSPGKDRRQWWLLLCLVISVVAAILTGRRKVLAIMLAFGSLYALALMFLSRKSRRQGIAIMMAAGIALLGATLWFPDANDRFGSHLARSGTVFSDAGDRLYLLGFGAVRDGLTHGGLLGLGAGVGAQGTQYFSGTGGVSVGGTAESGLGKIVAELGLVGLLLIVAAVWVVFRQMLDCLRRGVREHAQLGRLMIGLTALLAANVPVFVGAAQVYGDPFVLILLGSMLGFVLAIPRVLQIRNAQTALREMSQMGAMSPLLGTTSQRRPAGLAFPDGPAIRR